MKEDVKVRRVRNKKVHSGAIYFYFLKNSNISLGNRNQKFTMKEAESMGDKF